MDIAPYLESDRLLLRPFKEEDAPRVFACCKNPNLGCNAGWEPHESLSETEEILRLFFLQKESVWAIIRKETGVLMGSIGLIPDPKRENPHARMLGYWLDEQEWGQGIMPEATKMILNYGFAHMQLQVITANCYPHNLRSRRVLEKQGFVYEGCLHLAELSFTGEIFDHLCYFIDKKTFYGT